MDVANFEQVNKLISSENPDYVINCSVRGDINYLQNKLKETGKPVVKEFEYRSDKNTHFLSVQEIAKLNKDLLT